MRVFIAVDAFADETQWRFLDRIVDKVADGWHDWQIENPKFIEETGWLDGFGRSWLRELFQKAALAAGYPMQSGFSGKRVLVSSLVHESEAIQPQQAAEYVSTPLAILMENRFSDGGIFLNTVLDVLGPDEMNEQRKIAPNSICYDSPGGNGELPKLVVDYARRAKAKGIPIRAVVFTDSDGTVPGEIQQKARRVQQACEKEGLPCRILRKRTIENYIPDEVLDAWMPYPDYEKRRVVDAVKRLRPEQRDYYPMKKGLQLQNASPTVQALYSGISEADRDELSKGFGRDVIEKLRDFPQALSAEVLRQRDGQGELDCLVKMIADAL